MIYKLWRTHLGRPHIAKFANFEDYKNAVDTDKSMSGKTIFEATSIRDMVERGIFESSDEARESLGLDPVDDNQALYRADYYTCDEGRYSIDVISEFDAYEAADRSDYAQHMVIDTDETPVSEVLKYVYVHPVFRAFLEAEIQTDEE